MAESKHKSWEQRVNSEIDELIDAAKKEREQWNKETREALGFYLCDRNKIFKSALSSEQRKVAGTPSQYHIPTLQVVADDWVAAVNPSDLKARYIPKLEQDELADPNDPTSPGSMARMGNALFDAYRTYIGWDTHMQRTGKEAYLFGRSYLGLYIDSVKSFPEQRADIRGYNPWQVYSTPGVPFDEASEIVTVCWLDRNQLKAQYPEFADEIDGVSKTDTREGDDGLARGDTVSWLDDLPGYANQQSQVDKNAVIVRERWKFDPSLLTYSREKSDEQILGEHAALAAAIETGDLALLEGWEQWDDNQYHSDHARDHWIEVENIRRKISEMRSFRATDPVTGIVTEGQEPVLNIMQQGVAEQAAAMLEEHAKRHDAIADSLEDWEEGKYPKYTGGWRHTILIGDDDNAIGVYDGYSKFVDFGIQGPPLYEFYAGTSALGYWGPSLATGQIDFNKLVNSFINAAKDNFNMFGSHQVIGEKTSLASKDFRWHNNPREPIQVPDGALTKKSIQVIGGNSIPPEIFSMVSLVLGLSEKTSGVYGSVRGQRQEGVRSGSHEQFLAGQNIAQLSYHQRLWKNSLERLCIDLFKFMLAVPPDDRYVKPLLEGKFVQFDVDLLRSIDFTVEVIMAPGGTSSSEERNTILLGLVQNLMGHPAVQATGGLGAMFELMGKAIKQQMPDLSEALIEMAPRMEQAAQQAQQMAQQQNAPSA